MDDLHQSILRYFLFLKPTLVAVFSNMAFFLLPFFLSSVSAAKGNNLSSPVSFNVSQNCVKWQSKQKRKENSDTDVYEEVLHIRICLMRNK